MDQWSKARLGNPERPGSIFKASPPTAPEATGPDVAERNESDFGHRQDRSQPWLEPRNRLEPEGAAGLPRRSRQVARGTEQAPVGRCGSTDRRPGRPVSPEAEYGRRTG